jgi:Spy/CpxP family protein refolding chaperone
MKKILLMIVAVVAFVTVSAQPPQGGQRGGGDRGAKTIEMLQKSLNMTPEQAMKFAPVYQGYMRELRQVRKDTKAYVDSFKGEEMTIKVAKKIMMAQLNGDKQIIQVKKEYIKVFVNYLNPEQLAKVFTLGQGPRRPRGGKGGPGGQGQVPPPSGAPQQ